MSLNLLVPPPPAQTMHQDGHVVVLLCTKSSKVLPGQWSIDGDADLSPPPTLKGNCK